MSQTETQKARQIVTENSEQSDQVPATRDPMELLDRAVQTGADVDVLERLLDLQQRWESNEARKKFEAALADLRSDLPPIVKDREVDYDSKGGRTNYSYADLGTINNQVSEAMAPHGLSFRWRTDSQQTAQVSVTCIISHRAGHSEGTTLTAKPDNTGGKNSIQAIGSTVTYLQRYTLMAALGLSATDDDDGRAAGKPSTARNSSGRSNRSSGGNTKKPPLRPATVAKYSAEEVTEKIKTVDDLKVLRQWYKGEQNGPGRETVLNEITKHGKELADSGDPIEREPEEETDEPERDFTDAAWELLEEHGLDPAAPEGTGKDGRVLKSDVQEAIERQEPEGEDDAEEPESDEEGSASVDERADELSAMFSLADEAGVKIGPIKTLFFLRYGVEVLNAQNVTIRQINEVSEHLEKIRDGEVAIEYGDEGELIIPQEEPPEAEQTEMPT